jgi:hypothetical protein
MSSPGFWSMNQVTIGAGAIGAALMGIAIISAPVAQAQQYAPPPPNFTVAAMTYRVVVDSSSSPVLREVQRIEPSAFLKNFADGKIRIQAGAFETAVKAKEQVDTLARLGIPATAYDRDWQVIYTKTGENQSGNLGTLPLPNQQPVSGRFKGYYTIVPVDREMIGLTYEKFRQLGIAESFITIGQQNRGWHVSVGVYPNRDAADAMTRFLHDKGGLDTRTYYEP